MRRPSPRTQQRRPSGADRHLSEGKRGFADDYVVTVGSTWPVPTQAQIDRFIKMNEAARKTDLEADRARTMSERLADVARLSRSVTSLRESAHDARDA